MFTVKDSAGDTWSLNPGMIVWASLTQEGELWVTQIKMADDTVIVVPHAGIKPHSEHRDLITNMKFAGS